MSSLSLQGLESLLQALGVQTPVPRFTRANVVSSPIDIYRSYVANTIHKLTGCNEEVAYDAVQWASAATNADLMLVTARLKIKGTNPNQLAQDLVSKFPPTPLLSQPAANGIFIPICFSPATLPALVLPFIFDRRASYGTNQLPGLKDTKDENSGKKKAIIEFSSPNIAKEFHAGHLRSTIIGAYISNLYETMGWDVVRINYLGDWGKQFGLLAVGWQRFGSEEQFAKEPLKHLLEVYAKINSLFAPEKDASQRARDNGEDTSQIESQGIFAERNAFFQKMEDGDPDAIALWKRFREVSIERYVSTYARLNIEFDEYSGESTVKSQTVGQVEALLKERNIYTEDNGTWIIDFKKHGAPNLGISVVRTRTGTTTYLLRDIAAVLERVEKHNFDKMIYVVSTEQDLYFQRLFKTIELMGYPEISSKLEHVNFGKVMGMSSRLGTVKLLGDILDDCGASMHDVMRKNPAKYDQIENPAEIADVVGITAVMVQDMAGKRIRNYPFDMAKMTSFEGDTGPYLQYAHARLCSIVRKADINPQDIAAADFSLLKEPHAINIIRLIAQYPEVTSNALKTLEPTTILTYLFRLAHQISSGYDVIKVIGAENREVMVARLALYEAARQVLENGMRLLGFTPVKRM
ncbi:arginyl-tRNA synthetase [Arthroderma uncinatum]|uniref:arginyl-tRNA synthetase n=1 Tax=Arthroderma uncinatum TaxID=74035 RepID=UPI00144AC762|nr:arginyl-tRNA synthetase [Arthroderma uncinatum]KAF3481831.1 arginyl-tRNA synthetase [Arthroderma uncinatum]